MKNKIFARKNANFLNQMAEMTKERKIFSCFSGE